MLLDSKAGRHFSASLSLAHPYSRYSGLTFRLSLARHSYPKRPNRSTASSSAQQLYSYSFGLSSQPSMRSFTEFGELLGCFSIG